MKGFIAILAVMVMLAGLASAACVGTAPPAYTVVWNVSRNTNCSDMSIVQNVIYVNKNSTLRFVNVTLKFNGSCTVATSCPRIVDKGGLKVYNSTFTFAKGVSGGYTNAFHLIVLRNGSSATFSRVYLNRTGAFANNFNPDFWAIKAKDAKLSVDKVRFANGRGIYISGNSTSRSNITNVNFTNTSGAIFVNASQRLVISDIRVNKSYNIGVYIFNTVGFNVSRVSLMRAKNGFVLERVSNFNIDGYNVSYSSTSMNVTNMSNFVIRNVYVKKVNYGLSVSGFSKADIRGITVDRSNSTSLDISYGSSFNVTGVIINKTIYDHGMVVSNSVFGNISNCIILQSGMDGMRVSFSTGHGIYHMNSSYNNMSGFYLLHVNLSNSTFFDVRAVGNAILSGGAEVYESAAGLIVRSTTTSFDYVILKTNGAYNLIYDIYTEISGKTRSTNDIGNEKELVPVDTQANLWAWGHPDGQSGWTGGTGPGWYNSNPMAALPTSPSFPVVLLTSDDIPNFSPVGALPSEIAGLYTGDGLQHPMSLATFGLNLFYAVKENTMGDPPVDRTDGAGKWMLVQHNIKTDNKRIYMLSDQDITVVYAVMNYKEYVLVFGRKKTANSCTNGLAQVFLFRPGTSDGVSELEFDRCLTCDSTGRFQTEDDHSRWSITDLCYYSSGLCTAPKNYVYDLNNVSVTYQAGDMYYAGDDCRKEGYIRDNYVPISPTGIAIGDNDWIYLITGGVWNGYSYAMAIAFDDSGTMRNMGLSGPATHIAFAEFYYFEGSDNKRVNYGGVYHDNIWRPACNSLAMTQNFKSAAQRPIGEDPCTFTDTFGVVTNPPLTSGGKEDFYMSRNGLRWVSNGSTASSHDHPILGPPMPQSFISTVGDKIFIYKNKNIQTYTIPADAGNCGSDPTECGEQPDGTVNVLPWTLYKDTVVKTYDGVDFSFGIYNPGTDARNSAHGKIYMGAGDAFIARSSVTDYTFQYFSSLDGGTQNAEYKWITPYVTSAPDAVYITGDSTTLWSGIVLQKYSDTSKWLVVGANIPDISCNYDDSLCGAPLMSRGGLCNELGSPADVLWPVSKGLRCKGKISVGGVCVTSDQCMSNYCTNGFCRVTHYCDIEATNICIPVLPIGSGCSRDAECESGNCINGTFLNYTGKGAGAVPNPFWGRTWTVGGVPMKYGVCGPAGAQCYVAGSGGGSKSFIHQERRTTGPGFTPVGLTQDKSSGGHNSFAEDFLPVWYGVKYGAEDVLVYTVPPPVGTGVGSSLDIVMCPWDKSVFDETKLPSSSVNDVNTIAFIQNQTFCDVNSFKCVNYDPSKTLDPYVLNKDDINPTKVILAWSTSELYDKYNLYVGTETGNVRERLESGLKTPVLGDLAWFGKGGDPATRVVGDCSEPIDTCSYSVDLSKPPMSDVNIGTIYARFMGISSTTGLFYPIGVADSSKTTTGSYISDFERFNKGPDGKWSLVVTTTTVTTTTVSSSTTTTLYVPTLAGHFFVLVNDKDTEEPLPDVLVTAKLYIKQKNSYGEIVEVLEHTSAGRSGLDGRKKVDVLDCSGRWEVTATDKPGYADAETSVEMNMNEAGKDKIIKMMRSGSTSGVDMECQALNGGTNDADKSRMKCTFNNIANLDGVNYDAIWINYKSYKTGYDDSVDSEYDVRLLGTTIFTDGPFPKEYSGRATVLFALKGGNICNMIDGDLLKYDRNEMPVNHYWELPWRLGTDIWYVPSYDRTLYNTHTIVVCADSLQWDKKVSVDVSFWLLDAPSLRHAIGSALLKECYANSDCDTGDGGGTCANNKCSNKPGFEDGYPKSVVDSAGTGRLAVALKWTKPIICNPNVQGCEPVTDLTYIVTRKSISGLTGGTVPVYTGKQTSEVLDRFDEYSDQTQLIGKTATYDVVVTYSGGKKQSAVGTVVIDKCSVVVADRFCKAGFGCKVNGLCSPMTTPDCAATLCSSDGDCDINGCDTTSYHCSIPPGGTENRCIPTSAKCEVWGSPTEDCSASFYCGQFHDIKGWIEQQTLFAGKNWGDIESHCVNRLIGPSRGGNWEVTPCYDDRMCEAGLTCEGELWIDDGDPVGCIFDPSFTNVEENKNRCKDVNNVVQGYCFPDSYCHMASGGKCKSGGPAPKCDPLLAEPNPACLDGQYCDSVTKDCTNRKDVGFVCDNVKECKVDLICEIVDSKTVLKKCMSPSITKCDYSVCKDLPKRGSECGCRAGYVCIPNDWSKPNTWSVATCKVAIPNNVNCGSGNSLGVPIEFLRPRLGQGDDDNADWLCASQNCLGDYFNDVDGKITGAVCKPANVFCDSNTVAMDTTSDPERFCRCTDNSIFATEPCANIDGISVRGVAVSLITEFTNDGGNPMWCYSDTLTVSGAKPTGESVPNYKCYRRLSDNAVCEKGYQCKSLVCTNNKCGLSAVDPNPPPNGPCEITSLSGSSAAVWNTRENQDSESLPFWDDNCGNNMYCEPCNYITSKLYDNENLACSMAVIKAGDTGRCRPAQDLGDWCYSTSQCNGEITQSGNAFLNLYCGVDSTHLATCSSSQNPPNWYCSPTSLTTYNKICLQHAGGGCIQDSMAPVGSISMYEDDTCYTKAKIGLAAKDTFCDSTYTCSYSSSVKKCQDWDAETRPLAMEVVGKCAINTCAKHSDGMPYDVSTGCWRDMTYSSSSHNVAPATVQLVYCDSTGQCRWKKESGASCSYNAECNRKYICLPSKKCGIQTGCKVDADCINPEIKKCVDGNCFLKTTESFTVVADNGLSKPIGSPCPTPFDIVMNCADRDTTVTASGTHSMAVKYVVHGGLGFSSGSEKYLGNSETVLASKMTGDLFDDLCDDSLISNNVIKKMYDVSFYPVINGVKGVEVSKAILVLARPLSVKITRCGPGVTNLLCPAVIKPTDERKAFVVESNNTHSAIFTPDTRRISCNYATVSGKPYVDPMYPRTDITVFGSYGFAVANDWVVAKYFKCTDEYGSVKFGTTLVNPAEYIFGLKFTRPQQIFLLLIMLLGIPVLVLVGSRVGKR